MPFEDLLVPKARCKLCFLIEAFDQETAAEVRIAVGKAKYSHGTLEAGLARLVREKGLDPSMTPSDGTIRNHRVAGHA